MKPGKLDLPTIWRGCTWPVITLRWKDANGNPFNLTNWTATAQSQNIVFPVTIDDPVNGETQISLSPTQTQGLKLGVEFWDWVWSYYQVVWPPVLAGKVEVKQPISFPA